jgi:hypothetical protein
MLLSDTIADHSENHVKPFPHTNLLNVDIQIANKIGFKKINKNKTINIALWYNVRSRW